MYIAIETSTNFFFRTILEEVLKKTNTKSKQEFAFLSTFFLFGTFFKFSLFTPVSLGLLCLSSDVKYFLDYFGILYSWNILKTQNKHALPKCSTLTCSSLTVERNYIVANNVITSNWTEIKTKLQQCKPANWFWYQGSRSADLFSS